MSLVLGLALASSISCRSTGDDRWAFRLTEWCLEELDEAAEQPPKPRHSTPYRGDADEVVLVGIVLLWPVLVDIAILPVTGVHDLFWS